MVSLSKAIVANTDLAASLAFNYKLANYDFALLISGSGENVFLKIKQTILELEPAIHEEASPAPILFEKISPILSKKLINVDNLQILYIAWNSNVLYIRSTTSDPENQNQQAYLLRENTLSPLIQPSQINQLISGHIKEGDKLLLISSLGNQISFESLKSLSESAHESFQDTLLSIFAGLDQGSPTAAILLSVDEPPPLQSQAQPQEDSYFTPTPTPSKKFSFPKIFSRRKFKLNRKRLSLLFLVTAILIIGLILFFVLRSPNDSANTPSNLASTITDRLAAAQNVEDPGELQKQISDIDALINQARTLRLDKAKVQELTNELDNLRDKAQKIYHLDEIPVFIELQLIKDKFAPQKLSYSTARFLLLDPNPTSLVTLQESQKQFTVLAGSKQLGNASLSSINGDFAFSYSPDKGVQRVDVTNSEVALVSKPDSTLGKITDLVGFANSVYLLSEDKSNIFKYSPVAKGYSDKISYLKDGIIANFTGAKQMQIDGSVWILKSNDEILKYTQGSQDFFALTGLPEPIQSISSFYVSSDTENLYILDKLSSKLTLVDKQGKYVSSYTSDTFKNILDFVVNEPEKKMYLLDPQKIYILDLK